MPPTSAQSGETPQRSASKQLEDAVFFTALSVADPAQRKRYLDQSCAGNPQMRAVVEEMLSAAEEADRFFAKGHSVLILEPDDMRAATPPDAAGDKTIIDEQIGTRIGRYKLLQRIGEGGCGVVYMAEQEEPVRRRVALKIIKLGMDTKSVIARFEAERQALALMNHPNIARVLDAGATDTGRPFFVMELVYGTKVNEYCDQNRLSTRERLHLFIQICHAIQHAHQKGIVHRDIKPSNVMVTLHDGVPVPKVIDFGIAKATEGRLTDNTIFTAYEQFIGTPAYMSPEQAERSGLDIDTRSDIYSLGVLLYELLTGRTPFDGKRMAQAGLDQIRQTLRESEPQSPSAMLSTLQGEELKKTAINRQAEPPKLAFILRGDLDWIVLKALEKDRMRRYQTANGLALDVQRYLDSEPVTARSPSQFYRFQKLVRRNRMVFGAVAAVAAALVMGLGASTWLLLQEREALREQAKLRVTAEQSEKRETELRKQAEAREKINQAAVLVSQYRFDEADKLLNEIKMPPPNPSYDYESAFRLVGDWLAIHGRWQDAAARFATLMKTDKQDDWAAVTLDYQCYGIVVAESGDVNRYQRFCDDAIANFARSTNGRADWRIVKACLLQPADKKLVGALAPLAAVAENDFALMSKRTGVNDVWGSISIALWKYRSGDYRGAEELCEICLTNQNQVPVQKESERMILALSHFQLGRGEEAKSALAQGRATIEEKFKTPLSRGDARQGFWWDWVVARRLMREAGAVIEKSGRPASTTQTVTSPE